MAQRRKTAEQPAETPVRRITTNLTRFVRAASRGVRAGAQRVQAWAGQSRMARIALLWMVAFLVLAAFFFSEVLKSHNYVEVFPREFVLPLAVHALTALLVSGVIYAIPKPRQLGPKAVGVLVVALSMVNYDSRLVSVAPVVKALIPLLPSNPLPVVSLILLGVLFGIGVGAGMVAERLQARYTVASSANILGAAVIVAVVMCAGQALPLAGMQGEIRSEASYVPTTELRQAEAMQTAAGTAKPDIYYIVLDRYTNNHVLQSQFGFDNTPFLDGLRAQGFSVDDAATSAYPYTAPSVASTLNMSYHGDDTRRFQDNTVQSATLYHNMIRQSQVVKLLQQQGYAYHSIGSTYGATYRAPLTPYDYACNRRLEFGSKAKCLHGVEISQFQQSPWYRFANVSLTGWPLHYTEMNEVSYVRDQLTHLYDLAGSPEQGGRFIFAHILVPHDPFLFRADGSLSTFTDTDSTGRPIKQKFVEQTTFINTQVSQLVQTIMEKSAGQAVVMLISDEGPYPPTMNQTFMQPIGNDRVSEVVGSSDMTQWKDEELAMKFGTLQAVHIPLATEEDLARMTPANAFRIVLDRYFGYGYGYLPKCQFGLPDGRNRAYHFTDITARLQGGTDPACKQFE